MGEALRTHIKWFQKFCISKVKERKANKCINACLNVMAAASPFIWRILVFFFLNVLTSSAQRLY